MKSGNVFKKLFSTKTQAYFTANFRVYYSRVRSIFPSLQAIIGFMLFLSVFIKSDFRAACFGLLWLWRALELVRDCHRKPQKCRLCVCVCMLSSTCACRVCSNYLIKLYLLRALVCVCVTVCVPVIWL